MIDTIGLTCQLEGKVEVDKLEGRCWTVHTVSSMSDGVSQFATLQDRAAGDLRLRYFAEARQLNLEVSLPRLVLGDNAALLDWPGCVAGIARATEAAGDHLGAVLPNFEDWQAFRLDAVWSWAVDPRPYLAALQLGRVRGTHTVQEPGSVRWRSMRSGRIVARFYDKSQEQGRAVGLPSRFEIQTRPKKQVLKVDGERMGRKVGDLNEAGLFSLLRGFSSQVGIDRPVRAISAVRPQLVEALGQRAGKNLFRVLLEAREFGGFPTDLAPDTRRKYESQLRRAGVGLVSLDGAELPGLVIGQE